MRASTASTPTESFIKGAIEVQDEVRSSAPCSRGKAGEQVIDLWPGRRQDLAVAAMMQGKGGCRRTPCDSASSRRSMSACREPAC